MTADPNTPDDNTPAPETAPNDALTAPSLTVRRAAAQALDHLAHTVGDETNTLGLVAALTEHAHAAASAHGLEPESWNHDRVLAMAIVSLFMTTVSTEQAAEGLRERWHWISNDEATRYVTYAANFLRA